MRIPKIETLVIIIIFLAVGLWAFQRCSSKRSDLARRVQDYEEDLDDDRPLRRDTVFAPAPRTASPSGSPQPQSTTGPSMAAPAGTQPTTAGTAPAGTGRPATRPTLANPAAPAPATAATAAKGSILYVAIDGLKVRKEPGLKGDPVAKLGLNETVTFLNQKTEWTQELNLGDEKVTDHWVKIRTKSGKEGWVFGAGVHYYKK